MVKLERSSKSLAIINLNPVILETIWSMYLKCKWPENLYLGGTESFAGTSVMSFQVGIGSLGGNLFLQVGLYSSNYVMLKSLLKSKDVFQVSSDLGIVNSLSISFFLSCIPKICPCLSKFKKTLPGIGLIFKPELFFLSYV